MPTSTTNYGLTKPDVGQVSWGASVNANFDTIDTLLHQAVSTVNVVTYSATPVFDLSLGNVQLIVLTGDVTSFTYTNAKNGEVYVFIIQQDATGGRSFPFPSNFKAAGIISAAAGTAAASSSAILSFVYVQPTTNFYATSPMAYGE